MPPAEISRLARASGSRADLPDSEPAGARAGLLRLVESKRFQHFTLGVILVNALTLGLETSPSVMAAAGPRLMLLDKLALAWFCVEIGLRLAAHRMRFFRASWNVFDFVIVGIALLPAGEFLSVLRTLRVLRAFRLISAVPRLRRVVDALLHAVPGVGAIGLLLGLVFYVCSIVAVNLFGEAFPQWFGTIGEAMFSLFQIMTLESWSMGIVRPVLVAHPWAWLFFVPFIVVASFTVLNLFVAIVVDSMNTMQALQAQRERESRPDPVAEELKALREEIRALKGSPSRPGSTYPKP